MAERMRVAILLLCKEGRCVLRRLQQSGMNGPDGAKESKDVCHHVQLQGEGG